MTLTLNREFAGRLRPSPLQRTWNKREPAKVVKMRAADLPGMVALPVRDLFPWMPSPIWSENKIYAPNDLTPIRQQSQDVLNAIDWSKIHRGAHVNLLANPHALHVAGEAYVAMLEEIAAFLKRERGAQVKLCLAESMGHIENQDWREIYKLAERFPRFEEVPQCGQGVEVDTSIGKVQMMHRLFNGDYFIHTHVTEMREAYIHRMMDRLYKPFGMSYARLETRSAYHWGFGPRTGQLYSRLIFESEFIQKQYTASIVLDLNPEGVMRVCGHNDLMALEREIAEGVLRNYGVLIRLMSEIDECVALIDTHYPLPYVYGGGLTFSSLECADVDFLDLDNFALFAPTVSERQRAAGLAMGQNKAIKGMVLNYLSGGLPFTWAMEHHRPFVVGEEFYKWLINDPCNTYMANYSTMVPDLPTAMDMAIARAGTDKVIAFDNTPGAFRVSEPLAELLLKRAPAVEEDVLTHRLPKWLGQRNLA